VGNEEALVRRAAAGILVALVIVGGLVWAAAPSTTRTASAALDCAIFSSQTDAQAVLEAGPLDPSTLDPDANGVACDELLSGEATASAEGSPPAGDGTPDPGAKPLPASPTPVPTPTVTPEELLPAVEEVPLGLVFERDEQRDAGDVAYQLAGQSLQASPQADASDELTAWGFDQALVRYFRPDQTPLPEAPDQPPPPPPSGIRWLWVAVYRFAGPASTAAAYDALTAAALATDERLRAVEIAPLGEESDAFFSNDADGLFHVWFRTDFDIVWIGGTASAGFPQAVVEALAHVVELRAGGEAPGTGLRVGGIAAPNSAANLRAEPSTAALIVTTLAPGTLLVVTDPAVANSAEGRDWWPVEVIATGEIGWVAGELLVPAG
jgi:hypothetical protein